MEILIFFVLCAIFGFYIHCRKVDLKAGCKEFYDKDIYHRGKDE